jgi:Resolvase, N terminal domain
MAPRRPPVKDGVVKAALYARVSTDDGRQTVANQVRQLRELAVAREFVVFPLPVESGPGAALLFLYLYKIPLAVEAQSCRGRPTIFAIFSG